MPKVPLEHLRLELETILREAATEQGSRNLPTISVTQPDLNTVSISLNEANPSIVKIYNNIPSEPELLWSMIRAAEEKLFETDEFKLDRWNDHRELAYEKHFKNLEEFAKNYDFVYNFRVANLEDDNKVALYYIQKRKGCCGHYDGVREDSDGIWIVGFNWGH